jgi:hypothetical protein
MFFKLVLVVSAMFCKLAVVVVLNRRKLNNPLKMLTHLPEVPPYRALFRATFNVVCIIQPPQQYRKFQR